MNSRQRALLLTLAATSLLGTGCVNIAGLANTALKLGMIKLSFSCVPEGAEIDTPGGAVAIESIRPGEYVIGYRGDPVQVLQVHAYAKQEEAERFYRVSFESGAVVTVCDMHRIGGQRARTLAPGRVVAGQTVSSVEIFGGVERSYDLLTEDEGYQIGGVPVNSMIPEMAEAASKLDLNPSARAPGHTPRRR